MCVCVMLYNHIHDLKRNILCLSFTYSVSIISLTITLNGVSIAVIE